MDVKKLTKLGLLTSLALIIFIIELRLPDLAPYPGMKLGLANIVTVYAVYSFTPKEAALMLISRILLGALFSGNAVAMIYSISGAFLCLLGMIFLSKVIDIDHIWICSIFGAVLHNTGQIAAAVVMLKSTAIISYLPFLLLSGCTAGLLTGICAQLLIKRFLSL